MHHVHITRSAELAIVTLDRGRVNALNGPTVRELSDCFDRLEKDDSVRGLVLTGAGKFFSFGFDIPEFLGFTKEAFVDYLTSFTGFYTQVFVFPKPVVAAVNGHAIAGGCMIATACDARVMASGGGKISLNEITFGASVFAGCVAMLKHWVGNRNAEKILYSGEMYEAEEARRLGLVEEVALPEELMARAEERARRLAGGDAVAFASIKRLVRGPIADEMRRREADSVREFADIWYSEATWKRLEKIEIRQR
ncbi:MAG: enoyl-CoA hydratase/isomerase family protein [Acidobacteriota bacterium]|nr:MAG: enoyl-CoA hydratase/isomerase family protein [Acidobacteriota bacterium]